MNDREREIIHYAYDSANNSDWSVDFEYAVQVATEISDMSEARARELLTEWMS